MSSILRVKTRYGYFTSHRKAGPKQMLKRMGDPEPLHPCCW